MMRFFYFPSRVPFSYRDLFPKGFSVRNSYPDIFSEIFISAGWHLVMNGSGDFNIREQNPCYKECWEFYDLDLVIYHWSWDLYENFIDTLLWVKKKRKKVLWVCHELEVNDIDRVKIRRKNRDFMLKYADYIVVLNERDYKKIKEKRNNVFLIEHFLPNSFVGRYIDMPYYSNYNSRLFGPFRYQEKTLGFYGTLREHKGVIELVKVWNKLKRKYKDWKLLLYSVVLDEGKHLVKKIESFLDEQLIWFREGYDFLPDNLTEIAILPYIKCNNSGMVEELISYECPVISTELDAFKGKAQYLDNNLEKLIIYGIENRFSLRDKVKKDKLKLLKNNIKAKKKILDIAFMIMEDILRERWELK